MPTPSIFPYLMKAISPDTIILDGLLVTVMADPDIVVEADIVVTADAAPIVVEVEPEIEIEVE